MARGRGSARPARTCCGWGCNWTATWSGTPRHPSRPVRQRLRLPCLWAGFKTADAATITGDGPELEAYCHRTGKSAKRLLDRIRREAFGLSLCPLPWVSHHWHQAVAMFADLERFPRRQVFSLRHLPGGLVGFQDAAEFDFLHSRFHWVAKRRPRTRRKPVFAPV